jgi:hypothetical protein
MAAYFVASCKTCEKGRSSPKVSSLFSCVYAVVHTTETVKTKPKSVSTKSIKVECSIMSLGFMRSIMSVFQRSQLGNGAVRGFGNSTIVSMSIPSIQNTIPLLPSFIPSSIRTIAPRSVYHVLPTDTKVNITDSINFIFQIMNRNARRAKRANHGKRPVSNVARRAKRRAFGNHRR